MNKVDSEMHVLGLFGLVQLAVAQSLEIPTRNTTSEAQPAANKEHLSSPQSHLGTAMDVKPCAKHQVQVFSWLLW